MLGKISCHLLLGDDTVFVALRISWFYPWEVSIFSLLNHLKDVWYRMNILGKFCAGFVGAAMLVGMAGNVSAEEAADSSKAAADAKSAAAVTSTENAAEDPAADKVAEGQKISINLAARSLALIRNNQKFRLYPVALGKPSTPTPTGYYKILTKVVNPTWTDPSNQGVVIPAGSSNPLGLRWMQIQGNYGIHGTNNPSSIGHYASNGCIRMNEQDVEALFDLVEVGTPVEITYNRVVVEKTPDDTVAYYIYPDGYGWQKLEVKDVELWLAGYGVDNFVPVSDIEKKIAASDGQPTYVAKVYPLYVDGKKLNAPAVVQNNITYLPAAELAKAKQISLGWKPKEKVLTSTYGQAVGYDMKGVLYCNADDAETLFHIAGSITSNESTAPASSASSDVIQIVQDGKVVEHTNLDQAPAKPVAPVVNNTTAQYHTVAAKDEKAAATPNKDASAPQKKEAAK